VFVGREHELCVLASGLDDAMSGRGALLLLSGEPGIGKSRVADEFATVARERGVRVLRGRGWEGAGAPAYWPWVQAIRSYLRGADPQVLRGQMGGAASDIAQMLPELHELFADLPPPASTDPESARFRLFDSAASFLVNAAAVQPLVVILDDLQAADTPSLLLLRFVAAVLAESRILVVGTYRDVELTSDHPLTEVIAELVREPSTQELRLRGLRDVDLAAFVRSSTGVEPHPLWVTALQRATGGNPLFVGEAVRLLAAEGRLDDIPDADHLRIAVPSRIREVIGRRVEYLSKPCRRALAHGAVLGPEFSLEVLALIGKVPREELLDLLDEVVQSGLVTEVQGALNRFRFSHDLVRETLYEDLSSVRRVQLHRRAAEALEEIHHPDLEPYLAELAHHYFHAARGGDPAKAVEYGHRAGEQAASSLAYEVAAVLYRMALQALALLDSPDHELEAELLLALGDAQARAGNLAAAREMFLRAATIARRTGDASQLARAALGYGGRFVWARVGADPHLVPLLQDALVLLGGGDDRLRVRLLARLSCALRSAPDREHNAALSGQAVAMARRLDDPATLCYALEGRFGAIWWPENPAERLEVARELLQLAEETGDDERVVAGHLCMLVALLELSDVAGARAQLDALAKRAEELRQPAQRWVGVSVRSLVALLEGDFETAEHLILEVLPMSEATPIRDNVSAARSQLFLLRREQGRLDEVEDLVRSAVVEFPWYPVHRAALACLLLESGRADEGRVVFEGLAREDFRALYRDNEWLLGMALATDACFLLGDTHAAGTLYEQLLPFAGRDTAAWAEGSVGVVDRYLGRLAVTLGRLEDAEAHLRRAIDVNERVGARPWVAHSQHDLATLLLSRDAAGDRECAEDLLRDALRTARDVGMTALEGSVGKLLGDAPAIAPGAAGPTARSVFRREGEYWSIAFEGQAFRLRDAKGLRHLARLLAAPGKELHALELVRMEQGLPDRTDASEPGLEADGLGDAGAVLDPQAKAAYRRRLVELQEDLDEAESWHDPERAAQAREEMQFLTGQLAGAVGMGGRDRRAASVAERARLNVTRAIKTAMARIADNNPALGAHLATTIHTGTFCSYTPDARVEVAWQL
jgi:tetratricopeptide (TPR) repeat protein